MRILISTFGAGDAGKVIDAMRAISYDLLVLVGSAAARESRDFSRLAEIESMSGHVIEYRVVDDSSFMSLVDRISEVLLSHRTHRNTANRMFLNISGGSKLLGDAALFASFRLGVEAYHVDGKVTRLPVLRGATARDRFTQMQARFIKGVGDGAVMLDELAERMGAQSKQSVERVMRELRKAGLLDAELAHGKISVFLTPEGLEVCHALVD